MLFAVLNVLFLTEDHADFMLLLKKHSAEMGMASVCYICEKRGEGETEI